MKIEKLEYYSSGITNKNGRITRWIYHPNNNDIVDKLNEIIDKLNERDDVEPVRHGEWIIEDKYTDYRTERCSMCGWVANRDYIQDKWFYCPNCGAEMDLEE